MPTPIPSHSNSTHSEAENLELYRKVWRQTILRLRQERIKQLAVLRSGHDPERKATLRLMQIAHELEMFELCIDRANERLEILEGRVDPERAVQRERYLRLMAGLAKASNDAADLGFGRDYFDIGGEKAGAREWDDQWESELGSIAASELRSLAGEDQQADHLDGHAFGRFGNRGVRQPAGAFVRTCGIFCGLLCMRSGHPTQYGSAVGTDASPRALSSSPRRPCFYAIVLRRVASPVISTSTTSPGCMGATPAGVPVAMRSPGSSVMHCEM